MLFWSTPQKDLVILCISGLPGETWRIHKRRVLVSCNTGPFLMVGFEIPAHFNRSHSLQQAVREMQYAVMKTGSY